MLGFCHVKCATIVSIYYEMPGCLAMAENVIRAFKEIEGRNVYEETKTSIGIYNQHLYGFTIAVQPESADCEGRGIGGWAACFDTGDYESFGIVEQLCYE